MLANQLNYNLSGTKAETLVVLEKLKYNVPRPYYFTVKEWIKSKELILTKIEKTYFPNLIVVRSSTKAEDTADSSMAGAFESILNVNADLKSVENAVIEVIASYDNDLSNQVLIQPMVTNVHMSGVMMTQVLDDGSPYYVVNYDDSSGLTDTVTSGTSINKTVYIYNGVNEKDFDSPYLLKLLELSKNLQNTFPDIPLDIEFAIDKDLVVHLLQVRKITTIDAWKKDVIAKVSTRMIHLKDYVGQLMQPRPHLFGKTTLLGFMPDWNPAEMIGVVPRPLAISLYRKLITEKTWRLAREKMGYKKMPNVDLMKSLFGRVYIDVRNSINSFLPFGLNPIIAEKLVNAYLDRLDNDPHLHDKIEFEVVHTAYDFDFEKNFNQRYPNLLTTSEYNEYKNLLFNLTINAIDLAEGGSLRSALVDIEHLKNIQNENYILENRTTFTIADKINSLIDDCINFGTLPFSILARHGFIAEGLLRTAVTNKAISPDRLKMFRKSIRTVASEMSEDFSQAISSEANRSLYLKKYGHLRPSSYDILSPNYANRTNLFEGSPKTAKHEQNSFVLSYEEEVLFSKLLKQHGISKSPSELFDYCEQAIVGREYAKFVFTKHLSDILELIAEWGGISGFDRSAMSMLSVDDVLAVLFSPLTDNLKNIYQKKVDEAIQDFDVASSFKLSYLIRSVRDVHIVPMQRSEPNFIGDKRIECEIVHLTPYSKDKESLENKIICIEGADPGYDWIFTRNIAGLITKYGGTNSHMAIRSAEYGIAAAIGCGEQPFNRVVEAGSCLLDCQSKRLEPIVL